MSALPELPNLADIPGYDDFAALWQKWKAGRAAAPGAHAVLAACAWKVMAPDSAPNDASLASGAFAFLTRARPVACTEMAAFVGTPAADAVRLWRGIVHDEAEEARTVVGSDQQFEIASQKLLSYSLSEGAAVGFARKRIKAVGGAQAEGLVYSLDVPFAHVVMVECPQLCKEYLEEEEVLVFHLGTMRFGRPNVVVARVPLARF